MLYNKLINAIKRIAGNFGGLRDLNETQNEVGNTKDVAEVAASEKVTEVKTAENRGFKSGVKSVGNEKGVASGSAKSDGKNSGKSG
ncbi:hypothetical protein, partial [Lyticum sinuosum]|uniref:hypothetical protein n=1 Tax=Lyticum sinuosum TaxID=1332059 RepID=UPI002ACDEF71